jgi:hypothetical protein
VSGLFREFQEEEEFTLGANDGDDIDENTVKLKPDIMMLSSAEVTPFVIRLGVDEPDPAYMQIKTLPDGSLELQGPIYEAMDIGWSNVWRD